MWIFYKNSLTLNVYLRFFHLLFKLILTFPNSRSLSKVKGGQNECPILVILVMHWKYRKTEGQTIFRVNIQMIVYILFLLYFHNAVWCSEEYTDPSKTRSSAVSTSNGLMKTILYIEDLVTTFITFVTADIDFDFFNSILITRVTHPLCPGLGKANFSFFTFWLKKHLNV